MAEFKLDRLKYNWKGDWTASTVYNRDDVVRVNGASYVCVISHTSSPSFATDLDAILPGSDPIQYLPKWVAMTKGKSFIGPWAAATDYNLGDLVFFGGTLWRNIVNHTSTADWADNATKWTEHAEHIEFLGDWKTDTNYARGSIVAYGGNLYKCNTAHKTTTLREDDEEKWDIYYVGVKYRNKFLEEQATYTFTVTNNDNDSYQIAGTDTTGEIDDANATITINAGNTIKFNLDVAGHPFYIVRSIEGGYQYENEAFDVTNEGATAGTVSWTPTSGDVGSWYYICKNHGSVMNGEIVVQGVTTDYRKDELVNYGGSVFRVTESHTPENNLFDNTKFAIEFAGNSFNGEWSPLVYYNQGDIVRYGGYVYYALKNNRDDQPSRQTDDSTAVNWQILAKTNRFVGDWGLYSEFKTGDVVLRGGQLWVALQDVNVSDGDGSSIDYLDDNIWELVAPGLKFGGIWAGGNFSRQNIAVDEDTPYTDTIENTEESALDFIDGIYYNKGDVVYYKGDAWECTEDHQSYVNNYPGDNGSGYDYWDILVEAGQPGALVKKGDLLTYGLSRPEENDGSTVGEVRKPIGEQGQVLSVASDLDIFWRDRIGDSDTIFVDTAGVDNEDDGRGKSSDLPFRTVRYACEYVEDNYKAKTPTKIFVATGTYDEVGPMVIPAGCVVMGDELRATTVKASKAKPEYANSYTKVQTLVTHLKIILPFVIQGEAITPQSGNTLTQKLDAPISDPSGFSRISALLDDYQNWIEAEINSGNNKPTMTGSNNLETDVLLINAAENIHENREFIAQDVYRKLLAQHDDITWTENEAVNIVKHLIRGMRRDIKYAGNFLTVESAEKYSVSTNGAQLKDLFRVRDVTGIRQLTTDGLVGTLNPPGVFDLYQRPTGGACVALDPGWGAADDRTWINSRSPYIQGVTNIGTRCVGKKIDGALHNGGNKSMVSNDFTQVLSDGIGAWVLNNARAELVSVFTYYCQVGYLAEDGGVIRATNGNNSYGSFGSISDGNDPTETPENFTVNNRRNEALVRRAFGGGAADELFLFEYAHCGEDYETASATITGAGANAAVEYNDFRDGAVSNLRLVNNTGSGTEGGAGYLVRQASAQITVDATSELILSSNDDTQFASEIVGARIFIVAGKGVGQYGYITAYDTGTKTVTVAKDSTGTAGWDHVIAGYPLVADFDSTTTYRIEPRVVANDPGFDSVSYTLANEREMVDLTFGGDYQQFFGISGDLGTGEDTGATPVAATFNVVKSAKTYTVTLANAGIGYAVNDTITLNGSEVGGSAANNIVITVTGVTDDSSASITTFTFTGEARDGKWVYIANPDIAGRSDDEDSWQEVNMSFTGTFVKLLHGNDRWVAVAENENKVSFSYNGEDWVSRSLPNTEAWIDGAWGEDTFVIISNTTNVVNYSSDGLNWSSTSIPDNTSGDSSTLQWDAMAYGQGKFVAVSSTMRDVAISVDGVTWVREEEALPEIDNLNIVSLAFGNNRWIAVDSQGRSIYSFDGETWYTGGDLPDDVNAEFEWIQVKYNQGVFVCVGNTVRLSGGLTPSATDHFATSEDGVVWTARDFNNPGFFATIAGRSNGTQPEWITLGYEQTTNAINRFHVGCKAKLRANIELGKFADILIWDPGSNYATDGFSYTVTDSAFTSEVESIDYIHNGVLAQPTFLNRGAGYRISTSTITVKGDGFAEIVPEDNTLTVDGITTIPGPGAQLRITGILDVETEDPDDLKLFTGVGAEDLGDDGSGNGTRTVKFTISPTLKNTDNLQHATTGTMRVRYSQCRISGHDFLDIGTGNFEETNYPDLYADGAFFTAAPENEVYEINGGRVFYVSTDQDGNFRAGELFSVQQATGIVTISAEFFDLDGLSSLALGGVRLGGSGAVVNEFSTDPTFSADSNNVIPTQRAIATFLANRLSVGGENLETNAVQAGRVKVGTEDNTITMSDLTTLQFNRPVHIAGKDANDNDSFVQGGGFLGQLLAYRNVRD